MYEKKEFDKAIRRTGEVTFAYGYIRHFLQSYARSTTLSEAELTERVAGLLFAEVSREVHRAKDSVSTLRGEASEGGKTSRKVAVVKRSYRRAPHGWTKAARLRLSRAMKRRWREKKARE